jgi:EpsD family peptidyl-prolyl cis-trans isomerase
MKRWQGVALAISSCGLLAGCDGGQKAPTGQVVATVGKQEITMRDLRAEMGAFNAPDPKALKAAEKSALNNIIGRDILADEARKEQIDRTPDFAIAKQRAIDGLLAQALDQKVASQVPPATKDDAQQFVTSHPDIFAQRKIFVLDQVQMARPSDPALAKTLGSLKTLDEIQAVLTERKIPFKRVEATLDAVGADPRLVESLLKLHPDDLFILPTGQAFTVNVIKETRIVPFTGDQATAFAQQFVTRERTQEAVQRRNRELFAARKNDVKFSKDFAEMQPAEATPAAAPAAAAPASAAAASGSE